MGGSAAYFADLNTVEDVEEFVRFSQEKNLPLIVLGGGSNIIFPDDRELLACVGRINVKGFEVLHDKEEEVVLKIGAGENWDDIVRKTVERGLSGLEALSAIPGTAGATPVQNVGAYGQEIAQTLLSLEAFDIEAKKVAELSKEECKFSYRDSIFKHEAKGRYIILSLILKLSKKSPQIPDYPGVKSFFEKKGIENPSVSEIREAIIEIRSLKLPDPKDIASCGSFFKNPIVEKGIADTIKARYQNAVVYPLADGKAKIGAGWMIDSLGLKGKRFGGVEIYPHNALVLTNVGNATRKDLIEAVEFIKGEVKAAFGVEIEPEPVWIA
jgi:UDP-N-acetylmuramate dehydrogenase